MYPALRRTPLHALHQSLGVRFTDFAGWSMPLRFSGETAEHNTVRSSAGIFDLSHMGQLAVDGPEAGRALDYALVGSISPLAVGAARYTMLCHDNGGILDDLVAYRLAPDRFLVVANASNTPVVLAALRDRLDGFRAQARWEHRVLLAVQGPHAERIVNCPDASALKYYQAVATELAGRPVLVARTGYTGEDGFEIFCEPADAAVLWSAFAPALPAGLASRDTLRLEAGMALHGNELHVGVSPFEARLGRLVDFTKPDFVGRTALLRRADQTPRTLLVGLTSTGRRAARAGYAIVDPSTGARIGTVTSGAPSPTLGRPIALGYLATAYAEIGTTVAVDIRGTAEPFTVTACRFYSRRDA
ncbi:glycine cleavage system aminomethyltransferase GcvT [Catellatospora bangladeshensis]|uniref:aminomethyltransferase n=1 Tax=Catellatospora bangladeshensis TaxID=310355 RepID=A0A8J3JJP8_9ACTN|nr:glycine cleavage system aminomethyltransferase GcvT [Catellatospora bangladeshensis]GIF81931.1 aminomethyltransferase [Catellatospora bangladeshensis]